MTTTRSPSAVKSFFDEEKLPKKDVRIGLASNRIGVRTFDIDGHRRREPLRQRRPLQGARGAPGRAVTSPCSTTACSRSASARTGEPTRRVLLVVAPRDQVEPYTRGRASRRNPARGIDLEALGLLRAFVEPGIGAPTPDDTATVVVSIGHESSTLLVAGGGACEFTRVFDWGGGALEEAIAAALDVQPAEAATILRHLSLSGPGRQYEGLDEVARAKAIDAVRLSV